jgi:hypothetical protein
MSPVAIEHEFEVTEPGPHRFVLTDLEHLGGSVRIEVLREDSSGGTWTEVVGRRDIRLREGIGRDLIIGKYKLLILRTNVNTDFTVNVLREKQTTTISGSNRNIANFTVVSDFMEYERQRNDYRFRTPINTGTGLMPASGVYRLDVSSLPFAQGNRSVLSIEILREQGASLTSMLGPVNLALFDGTSFTLLDNESYIIRVTQVPIADGTGTIMSDSVPYVITVGAQKSAAAIDMSGNALSRISRHSVVNDSFQFIGQMNTYTFTAPTTGTYQFSPNLLHGQSVFSISDPWGGVNQITLGERGNIRANLVAGAPYRLHVAHQHGNPLGAYAFTVIYP